MMMCLVSRARCSNGTLSFQKFLMGKKGPRPSCLVKLRKPSVLNLFSTLEKKFFADWFGVPPQGQSLPSLRHCLDLMWFIWSDYVACQYWSSEGASWIHQVPWDCKWQSALHLTKILPLFFVYFNSLSEMYFVFAIVRHFPVLERK